MSLSSRRKSTNSQWRKKRKCIIVKPLAEAADVALMVTSSHHASTYFYFDHLGREYFKPRVVDYLISVHLWPVLCQPWRTEIHVTFWGWGHMGYMIEDLIDGTSYNSHNENCDTARQEHS